MIMRKIEELDFWNTQEKRKWTFDWVKGVVRTLALATLLSTGGSNFNYANGETLKAEEKVREVRTYEEYYSEIEETQKLIEWWLKDGVVEKINTNINILNIIEVEIKNLWNNIPEVDKDKWQELLNRIKIIKERYEQYKKENNIK